MARKRTIPCPAAGAASLFVILGVLCLAVFAVLSVSTVKADERLGDSTYKAVSAYYAADNKAEEILAMLRAGELPQGVTREGNMYSYSCVISENQVLQVRLRLENTEYEILRWQAVPAAQWQADNSIPVWQGD